MFSHIARYLVYWLPENPAGEDPFMQVARSLADFNVEREEFSTLQMDTKIAAGLFWGVTEQLELNQLQACLVDVRSGKEYMEEGFENLWRLNTEAINDGFTMMVNAWDLVPHLAEDCMSAQDDWATLDGWADAFFHPFEFLPNCRKNISEHEEALLELATLAQTQLEAEEFFHFGQTFGRMNAIIITKAIIVVPDKE